MERREEEKGKEGGRKKERGLFHYSLLSHIRYTDYFLLLLKKRQQGKEKGIDKFVAP